MRVSDTGCHVEQLQLDTKSPLHCGVTGAELECSTNRRDVHQNDRFKVFFV